MTEDSIAADETQVAPDDLNEEDKVMLIFSYLWVLAIVPFMVTRREYVRWHAKQGLILCGVACLVSVFRPVRGDARLRGGCFLGGGGAVLFAGVRAPALLGRVLGGLTAYRLGGSLGRSFFFLKSAWARAEIAKVERWFGGFGP